MRILSREAFTAVLDEARARTDRLDPGQWTQMQQVAAQLAFMAEATRDGRMPSQSERERTTLGPIAARDFEATDPDYASLLAELDYTFHRYPLLPQGPPVRRRGILQVWSGRQAFRKIVLDLGVPRLVSNTGVPLDPPVPADMPHVHILWGGVSAHVLAVGAHRLTIGGRSAWYGEMANRGWMTAGSTTFRFLVEDHTPPPVPVRPRDTSLAALRELERRCEAGSLYAVIDAARSPRALQLVEESVDTYASLYDGEAGRAFDDVAPYLVQLRGDSWLLERLMTEGWGDAWGIYIESRAPFDAVRRHLRQFLKVEAEGESRPLFFRFYDPRVFTTFAEVISPEQRAQVLAELDAIVYEDSEQRLRRLTPATT